MTQSTILSAAQSAATSTPVDVIAGDVVTIGLFAASQAIPAGVEIDILIATPGRPTLVTRLSQFTPVVQLTGPGTFTAARPNITAFGVEVGVYLEV